MPSPTSSSSTSAVPEDLANLNVDALLDLVKWGGPLGTGAAISFSFPWTTNSSALFAGYNGAAYSPVGENTAAEHYGLSAGQQAAARGALLEWADVANLTFLEVPDTSVNVGDIRFAWTSATQWISTGQPAWGWSSYPNSYWPSGGDIWISTQASGYSDPDWSAGSFNYVALIHEIGHALGLKHPFEGSVTLNSGLDNKQYSVMSYTPGPHSLFLKMEPNASGGFLAHSFYVQPDTPMLFDIAAIQYLYGANLSYRAGNDVYTFDASTPFMRTLWDAGGNDTISVANFAKGCIVDLQPGHFSKITIESDSTAGYAWSSPPPTPTYDGTDNLAIAYGAIIENAVGGQGDDVLRGNDVSNHLDGGAGNDTLSGGPGNDYLDSDANQRAGADVLYGGSGDDTFYLDSIGDQVVEYANEGTDTLWVAFSYSLAPVDNVENLFAAGLDGCSLSGNGLDNMFRGTAGKDTISGGLGNDTVAYDGSSSSYVVSRTATGYTISSGSTGIDALTSIEFAQFSDKLVSLLLLDFTAPVALTFSPADGATGVGINSNVVVTFNEAIARGTGSIVLKTAAGATVETFNAASSAKLSISGSTLTIDPTVDMAYDTGYAVVFAPGTLKDLAGNSYAGASSYDFKTAPDTTGPSALAFSPADGATGVPIETSLAVTFSEAIERGTGSIFLKTAAGATVETFNAATSANLSVSGNTLTIDPTVDLKIYTPYHVEFGAGAIEDLVGNDFVSLQPYDFRSESVEGLYQFFVAAFAAAPGVEYMTQLADAFNFGMSLREIVNIFTTKPQFTGVYPESLNDAQLATALVGNIVKSSATDQAKAEAVKDIQGALETGSSRGDVIYQVFGNLATKPLDDPEWGHTAKQFDNQTAVAHYFTEVMEYNTTDLPTLRAVLAPVTDQTDVSTPEQIAILIGVALAGVLDRTGTCSATGLRRFARPRRQLFSPVNRAATSLLPRPLSPAMACT